MFYNVETSFCIEIHCGSPKTAIVTKWVFITSQAVPKVILVLHVSERCYRQTLQSRKGNKYIESAYIFE